MANSAHRRPFVLPKLAEPPSRLACAVLDLAIMPALKRGTRGN